MIWRSLTVGLLLVLMLFLGIHTLTSVNQDIGRHLTLGKLIWNTGSVPDTNLFSYTAPDFPFTNHHWLGEVLLFGGERLFGLQGLIIVKAFILMLAFGLAFFAAYRKELGLPALGLGLLAIAILVERTDVRPEILSFLFYGWYLFVLFRLPKSRWVWTLPLVQVLWVNTHIYFFMGPLVFGLFMVGNLVKSEYRKTFSWRHPHFLAGLLIMSANLVNPSGIEGALYPLTVFDNYGYSIMENQTPFFLKPFGYPQFTSYAVYSGILVILGLFTAYWRHWREHIFSLGLVAITAWLALDMIRNFPLFSLAMMPVGMSLLGISSVRPKTIPWGVPVLLLALIYSVADNQVYAQIGLGKAFGLHVPSGAQQAVDFYRTSGLKGPIFNNFDVGSFLIWKLPEEKVFIDGRPEAYPAEFIQKVYIPMQEDPELWKKYSEQYGIQTVFWNYQDITPWSQKFLAHMLKNPGWLLVYRDSTIVIFTRK